MAFFYGWDMSDIKLYRWYNDDCTIARLTCGSLECFTLELPDYNNQRNISCIPEGEYDYHVGISPKNGRVIKIDNVPNRSHIQIHKGNYTSQIEGCILPGDAIRWLNTDSIPDVTNSADTLKLLLSQAPQKGRISIFN